MPGIRSSSIPNNSHIIVSDRIDLLLQKNVEFLHNRHVVSIRGITNNALLFFFFLKKIMAEDLFRVDRVWKTQSRGLIENGEGDVIIQKLMGGELPLWLSGSKPDCHP